MIEKASEVKQLIIAGWELWYLGYADRLPGRWEMRYRNEIRKISWDAIELMRRNLDWCSENLSEVEEGRDWIYSYKQKSLNLN